MQRPILSITIPTYRRARFLRELLQTIFQEGRVPPPETLEILVSDNCSPDDTGDVVRDFTERGLPIRYLRNEQNIGPDPNFIQCYRQAAGKYVWVLGDDDLIRPDGVLDLVTLLQNAERSGYDYDLVYLSSAGFAPGQQLQETDTQDKFGRFAEEMTDRRHFIWKTNALLGLISVVIVNKERLESRPMLPLESLIGSMAVQMAWVFPALQNPGRVLYVWKRLVAYRSANSGGWGAAEVFGIGMYQIAQTYFGAGSPLVAALVNGTLSAWMPDAILGIRNGAMTGMEPEDFAAKLRPYFRSNWRFWVFVYPVATLPLPLAKVYHKVFRGVVRVHRILDALRLHLVGHGPYLAQPR